MYIDHFRGAIKRKTDETFEDWCIQSDNKILKTRLKHMRKYRQQHEQLQAVIIRDFKPATQQSQVRDNLN